MSECLDEDEFGPIDSLRPIGEIVEEIMQKTGVKNERKSNELGVVIKGWLSY